MNVKKVSSQLSKASSPPALGFKKLILIRHAQAHHNIFDDEWVKANKVGDAMMDPQCPLDPYLTELGEEQAYSLHKTSKAMLCKSTPRTHPSPPKPQNTNPAPPQPSLRSCFSRLLAFVFARRRERREALSVRRVSSPPRDADRPPGFQFPFPLVDVRLCYYSYCCYYYYYCCYCSSSSLARESPSLRGVQRRSLRSSDGPVSSKG